MEKLDIHYRSGADYRELFSIWIDFLTCEDTAVGITKDGTLLYIESKLMNSSSAYWVQSTFYGINREEFRTFLNRARSGGYLEKAIRSGQTTEEELKQLAEAAGVPRNSEPSL